MRSALRSCLLALPLLAACAGEGAGVHPVAEGTAPALTGEARAEGFTMVVRQIARGTCEREQSCGTIGPGATFSSREQCLDSAVAKYGAQLDPGRCPGGIDKDALAHCLESLEAGQCSSATDTVTRDARCSPGDLCLH